MTVEPVLRATCRSRTATSRVGAHPESTARSASPSRTTRPPRVEPRNSEAVVRAWAAAFRDGVIVACAAPLGVEAGGVLPMTRVARPSADSARAAPTAYLGRVSSNAMASPEGIRPEPVRPLAGREVIQNGSAWSATRAKHARAIGDAMFAPARVVPCRTSTSYE